MNRLFLIFCLWMGISLHAQYSFSSIDEAETEMRNVLKTVEQKTDKGQELCTDARKVMDQVEMQTTDQAAHLGLMTSSLDLLRRRGEAFIRQLPEMEKLGGTIRSAGLEVSKARLQARRQAQSGCERGIKVDEARSQETQKSLLQDIKQALAQVEAQSQLALKAQGPVPAAAKQVDALWSDADQWTKEFSEQGQQLEQVERVLNQISDQLESAEGMQEELDTLIKRLEEDVKKASDILAATQETFQAQAGRSSVIASSLSTIKELYKQAVEAQQKLSSCRSELEQRVSDLEDPIEAVDTDWQNLHDRWNELRNETLDEDGSVAKMQELWLTAKASVSTIDQFLEDIQAAMEMARGCLAQAGASAEAPITFPVPDVVGLSVEDAIRKLEAEGLIPVKIRGSDAPTPEQANTVELQLPQAGKRVGAGEQINIKIYQALPEQLTVPDLMGMSAQEAHQAVEGVGLELSIQAGSYAPSRSEAYTVQEQDPKSGTRVEAGDTVRVRIFASYPDARTVPNLIGLQENEANTLAKQAGLQVQQSKGGEAPSPDKEGKVAAQQPPPGSDAEAGDVLSVVIFGAPKDVPEVPNLIGLSLEQATQLLKDLGLPYKENRGRAADKAEDVGLVYEQTPELGARIDLRSGTVMLIAFGPLEQAAPLTDDSRKIPSELYVACQSFFPKLPDELPEGQKYRDWIRSQAADKVQLVPTEAPVFLRIDQAALQSYDLAWFARGQRLACPVQVTLADKKTGKRVAVDGALLLQVMGSYSSYDTFIKDYPKEKFADEGEQISFLHFRSSNGVFDDSTTPGAQNISYRGGPLQRGWAPNMQAANFSLFRGLLDYLDCFVATAVFASWDHPNVKALREFRDLALQNDPLGRRLIHAYYRIGPRLAEKVRAHPDLLRLLKQTFSRFAEIWTTEPAKAEAFARSHYERALVFFDAMETSLSKAITIDPFKLICDASATGKAQQGTLADESSPAKQAALTGDIYFYGQGVPVDYPKALDWYLKAAELGSAEAMNNVAYIYEKGLGIQQDLGLAAEWYQKAAEAGLPVAMNNIGWMYFNGLGIEQDLKKAIYWYGKGANDGDPNAQSNLGYMYQQGIGIDEDLGTAYHWYLMAARQGLAEAQHNVGWMLLHGQGVRQNLEQALYWYQLSAEAGYTRAQTTLGWLMEQGISGKPDYAQAALWYQKAVSAGDPIAMNNLAWLYQKGLGVEADINEAVILYRQASDGGYSLAHTNLGLLYLEGEGVPQDYSHAMRLFAQAAEKREPKAINNLGYMYEMGLGTDKDMQQALQWYALGASMGDSTAQYNLGRLYEKGLGGDGGKDRAVHWYLEAARGGSPQARERLKQLGVDWGANQDPGAQKIQENELK